MYNRANSGLLSLQALIEQAGEADLDAIERAWLWGMLMDARADLERWLGVAEVRRKRGMEAALQEAHMAVRAALERVEAAA